MSNYLLPKGMRYSTLLEREEFYKKEFNEEQIKQWFKVRKEKVNFAVIIGRHTKIYSEEYREDAFITIIIDEYEDFREVKKWTVEFLPESVYYDRNVYDEETKKNKI